VKVIKADDRSSKRLDAVALNDTNLLELRVFGNGRYCHAVLVARLDNLGKGASGAAAQNVGIMLGVGTSVPDSFGP
jgi:N-acetyl-gamma-glutamyl-phosphate reductase